ncbi:MAG: ABC transporter substrate-binding protein [Deltaproteobacteria bacterium]|nr:ABC transporter substrate-binding protein [Deltaproteobacteria bacterium]
MPAGHGDTEIMKRHVCKTALALTAVLIGISGSAHAAGVRIGYQLVYGPWKAGMKAIEAEGFGGRGIEFVKFTSGSEVVDAMASGSVDISFIGSSPMAAGYSRDVDLQVIYVHDNIHNAEALVVDDSISAPQDLRGKTIAAPFGSTAHFHLMFALEQFNIPPQALGVIDLSPPDMAAAWERGDVNGGFVWYPALGRMKQRGRVLISSGDLSNWGNATFDAMAARKGFTNRNPIFTCQWVKMVASADADYRANPEKYGPGAANAKAIAAAVSGNEAQIGDVLALYDYPTLQQQISPIWLGGGVQEALKAASEFLKSQGKLDKVLKSYADSATPRFAKMALEGGC